MFGYRAMPFYEIVILVQPFFNITILVESFYVIKKYYMKKLHFILLFCIFTDTEIMGLCFLLNYTHLHWDQQSQDSTKTSYCNLCTIAVNLQYENFIIRINSWFSRSYSGKRWDFCHNHNRICCHNHDGNISAIRYLWNRYSQTVI